MLVCWLGSQSCTFLWYLNSTFTHAFTSRSEITTARPLHVFDADLSSEYQSNSRPSPLHAVYIFAVGCEHIFRAVTQARAVSERE